jgi:hypothetical protein
VNPELFLQRGASDRWMPCLLQEVQPSQTNPSKKEITMLNPSFIASHAAGACALAFALLSPVQAAPVLEMSAATSATGIDLTVRARDVVDLYGYQFTLNFNPGLLNAVAGTEGAFLPSGGTTFFDAGTIDNSAGSISFAFGSLIGAIGGVNGSGDLVTFSFGVERGGFASFTFSDVEFLDSTLTGFSVDTTDLVTQVGEVPEPGSLFLAATGLFALLGGRAIKPKAR